MPVSLLVTCSPWTKAAENDANAHSGCLRAIARIRCIARARCGSASKYEARA